MKRDDDRYGADYAVIEGELTGAQSMEFAEYAGFLANYGIRLRELAAKHPFPDGAFIHLRTYADEFLEELHRDT
ncbi:hypothetical protein [Streptomyces sp. NPDC021020]|uniref:hypothetical protein n=1 Tax=Streptomyces sp. NPDC021020 TaxID=3365109 RepID=UPI003798911D